MCHKCTALGRAVTALYGQQRVPVHPFDFPFTDQCVPPRPPRAHSGPFLRAPRARRV